MSGLDSSTPIPTEITLHKASDMLDIAFDCGQRFSLSREFLCVYSPSAEVRGHRAGQETLQTGKLAVSIVAIEAVGRHAIRPIFDGGVT